jgi:hypothetical protein
MEGRGKRQETLLFYLTGPKQENINQYFLNFPTLFSIAVGENMLFRTAMEEAVVSMPPKWRKEIFKKLDETGTLSYPMLSYFTLHLILYN